MALGELGRHKEVRLLQEARKHLKPPHHHSALAPRQQRRQQQQPSSEAEERSRAEELTRELAAAAAGAGQPLELQSFYIGTVRQPAWAGGGVEDDH